VLTARARQAVTALHAAGAAFAITTDMSVIEEHVLPAAVRRAQAGERAIPAGRLRPLGALHWFIDREAAGQ
jgi:hypothetical protein